MLNLNRLVYFAAVVEAGSFTAAARRLNVAKTVVSQHVARLEAERGTIHLRIDAHDDVARQHDLHAPAGARCRPYIRDIRRRHGRLGGRRRSRNLHRREARSGPRQHRCPHAEHLLPPFVKLPGADPVLARNLRRRQVRAVTLGDDVALLLQRPTATSLATGDDLHPFTPSAPTIGRMTALIHGNDVRRFVHPRFASQHSRAPQCAGAATLTRRVASGRPMMTYEVDTPVSLKLNAQGELDIDCPCLRVEVSDIAAILRIRLGPMALSQLLLFVQDLRLDLEPSCLH